MPAKTLAFFNPLLLVLFASILAGCAQRSATEPVATPAKPTASPSEPKSAAQQVTSKKVSSQGDQVQPEETSSNGRPLDKTFDDIKFDIEPDAPFDREMLTEEIEALGGKTIRIRGYILPTAQKRGIKQFVLVRDNQECCFGPGAALYDCILIDMAPGKSAEFSIRPVEVQGQFRIEAFEGPDGKPLAIYQMQGDSVER